MKTTTTRFEEQERRTKRPNKRIFFFFLLSHCTFIKRFIIFQAFSDSLRPICATQKHRHKHRHAIHTHTYGHTQSARMNILFYFFEWRGQLLWICFVYMHHIYIACVNIWMNNGTYQRPPRLPPSHIPYTAPMCIYELRKELKLLFWRVLLRSSSYVSDVFSFVTDMSHYLAL